MSKFSQVPLCLGSRALVVVVVVVAVVVVVVVVVVMIVLIGYLRCLQEL